MPFLTSWQEFPFAAEMLAYLVWGDSPDESLRLMLDVIDQGAIRNPTEDWRRRGTISFVEPPDGARQWPEVVAVGSDLPLSPFGFLVPRVSVQAAGGMPQPRPVVYDPSTQVGSWGSYPPEARVAVLGWAEGGLWQLSGSRFALIPRDCRAIVPNPRYAERLARAVSNRNAERHRRWSDAVDLRTAREVTDGLDWNIITVATHPYWRTAL